MKQEPAPPAMVVRPVVNRESPSFQGGEDVNELHIPETAGRVGGLIGRKCRVSCAYLAKIIDERTHEPDGTTVVTTGHKKQTAYKVGQYVYPDQFDDRITMECTHGIHCYRTLEEVTRF